MKLMNNIDKEEKKLKMAVPEGIKCIIKSVEGVSSILDDPRSEKMRLMVLVPTVRDAVTLCKKYKNIEMVNLGNAGKMTSGEKITLTKELTVRLSALHQILTIQQRMELKHINHSVIPINQSEGL